MRPSEVAITDPISSTVRAPSGGSNDSLAFDPALAMRWRWIGCWKRGAYIGCSLAPIVHGCQHGADSQARRCYRRDFHGFFPLRRLGYEEVRGSAQHSVGVDRCARLRWDRCEVHHLHLGHVPDDLADMDLPVLHVGDCSVVEGPAVEGVQSNRSRERIVVDVSFVDRDDGRAFLGGDGVCLAIPLVGEARHRFDGRRCNRENAEHAASLAEWRRNLDHTLPDLDAIRTREASVDLERVA